MRVTLSVICICLSLALALPLDAYAWYSGSYQYCRKLTMTAGGNSGGVATTTTAGFALVATSTISTLAATSSSGRIYETSTASGTTTPVDVAITNGTDCNSASGTLVDFYFEKYVTATGEFVLWAESSDISSTSAKTLLMYYGYPDSSATDESDESGVFGALGEEVVWNLHEDPSSAGSGGILDSTANNIDGTDNGSMTTSNLISGMVDGAFDFDGSNDYVASAVAPGTTNVTISAWIRIASAPGSNGGIAGFLSDLFGDARKTLYVGTDGKLYFFTYDGAAKTTSAPASTIPLNSWVHVVGRANGATLKTYMNGAEVGSVASGALADTYLFFVNGTSGSPASNGHGYLNADVDDVRVYTYGLHAMDILTIYNNTKNSSIFWTFGAEETQTPPALPGSPRYLRLGTLILLRGTLIIK